MSEFFVKLKKYSIITIVVTALLGILLIAYPDKMIQYTALIVGGGIIALGVAAIINYFVNNESRFSLVAGIISAVVGVIICCAYRQIVSIMIFVLGVILLIGGVVDLVNSVNIAVRRYRSWIVTVILSIVSIVLGVLSIVNPFHTQNTIVQLIGAGFAVFAVLELISYIQVKVIAKKVRNEIKNESEEDGAIEVDYEEVDDN